MFLRSFTLHGNHLTTSHDRWLNSEQANDSRTISVPLINCLMMSISAFSFTSFFAPKSYNFTLQEFHENFDLVTSISQILNSRRPLC
jgi:hypothetical protein